MMKKICTLIFVCSLLFMVSSCSKKQDIVTRKDNPSNEMITTLNLEGVKNGNSLIEVDNTANEYYDIKMAADYNSTFFVHTTNLDNIAKEQGDKIHSLSIKPLTFTSDITTTETSNIINKFYGDSGIKAKQDLAVSVNISNDSWDKQTYWNYNVKNGVSDAIDKFLNGEMTNINLSVIYLPTYIEHYQDSKLSLAIYAMLPVYFEITTLKDGKIESEAFNNISTPAISFTDNNLLPSA